jgi:hypothetical protein
MISRRVAPIALRTDLVGRDEIEGVWVGGPEPAHATQLHRHGIHRLGHGDVGVWLDQDDE